MGEYLDLRGTLEGHGGWVTALTVSPENPNTLLSSSRDNSVLVWELTRHEEDYGFPVRALTGHSHFVSDVTISVDGQFALTSSWDRTLKLWEIESGNALRTFSSHTKDVMSVAFSPDNRQIVSCGRDRSIKLWNTLGECKYTLAPRSHTNWVSCVRFSPSDNKVIVSAGWDGLVKVWSSTDCSHLHDLEGHTDYVNTVAISPDGSLCASGGKDGIANLWDLASGSVLYHLDAGDVIHAMAFSPNRYWLCAASSTSIKIWDLESKVLVDEIRVPNPPTGKHAQLPFATSLSWSADGTTLYAGYTDNKIRCYSIKGGY